jgi:hypothetical protein
VADVAACLAGRSSASKLRAHSLKAKAQSSFHRDKIGLARPVVDPVPGVPVDQFDRFLIGRLHWLVPCSRFDCFCVGSPGR